MPSRNEGPVSDNNSQKPASSVPDMLDPDIVPPIKLKYLIAIGGFLFTVAGTYFMMVAEVSNLRRELQGLDASGGASLRHHIETTREEFISLRERMAETSGDVKHLRDQLDRIERRIDRPRVPAGVQ